MSNAASPVLGIADMAMAATPMLAVLVYILTPVIR